MAIIDPVSVIKKIYMSGKGGVPYPTFMLCFNDLLEPGTPLRAKKPTEELKEKFEACCMSMNVGIEDTQDRHKDREREFYEIIWPVWEKHCKNTDVARYQKLIDGVIRRQVEAEKEAFREQQEARRQAQSIEEEIREDAQFKAEKEKLFAQAEEYVKQKEQPDETEQEPAAEEKEQVVIPGDVEEVERITVPGDEVAEALAQDPFADYDDVLRETGQGEEKEEGEEEGVRLSDESTQLVPEREHAGPKGGKSEEQEPPLVDQAAIETQIADKKPVSATHDEIIELDQASMEEIRVVPEAKMYNTVADLIRAVTSEEMPVFFTNQKEKKPYAFYKYRGEIVEVKLIEANNAYYLLLGYPRGHGNNDALRTRLKEVMDELRYKQTGPYAFEKVRGKNKHKVRIGSKSTNVGQKRARKFTRESLIGSLNDLNMILTSILDRVHQVVGNGTTNAGD